jgi:hypothetical protein
MPLWRTKYQMVLEMPRSFQLFASRREDHFPELRSAVFTQGATHDCNGLDRQGVECGMPQGGHWPF